MHRQFIRLMVAGVLGLTLAVSAAGSSAREDALDATIRWLELIDDQQYAESWQAAAAYFKNAVQRGQWEQAMRSVRRPLGEVMSRKVKTRTYTTVLPGAPDGEYVVIQFESVFEHKKAAIETATPMKDTDGVWRVSGYYIK